MPAKNLLFDFDANAGDRLWSLIENVRARDRFKENG